MGLPESKFNGGTLGNWDWSLFLAINQFAGRSRLVDAVGVFFAAYAYLAFGVLLVGLWFLPASPELRRERQQRVINGLIALAGALLTLRLLGMLFYRARPFVGHTVTLLVAHAPDTSFPSEHTTFAFVLLVALFPVLGRTRWFWLALGVTIGIARVFVGVHYPTDVLGGAVLGTLWGGIALALAPWLRRIEWPVLEKLARLRLA